ncbi:MAG: trypsin-like peptidase domain-containing protein [Tannerellaceae bacterium]|nr:trypsin-like peptidase domain-containing protein [Tannerellaceae bacterium]
MKRNSFVYLIALLPLLIPGVVRAQVSHGGTPIPFVQTRYASGGLFEEMPAFDLEEQLRADSLEESGLRSGYRFAYKFMTHYNRSNSGSSLTLPDGTRLWRLGIRSRGASSINILFTEYELPEGAQVFVYNPSQTQVLGAFNRLNNSELGILPVAPVTGDELIVEYHEPAQASFPGRLTVGEVNHGYRTLLRGYEPAGDNPQFSCMPSPVCYGGEETFDPIERSVVLLMINGSLVCTGVLVNNASNDGKPYLLTASHCLNENFAITNPDYEKVAGSIVCFFNYKSPLCDTVLRGTEEQSVASASYRAVYEKNDLALLELLEKPPVYYQPYYAGWNIDDKGGKPVYTGIHHPGGSTKRISRTDGALVLTTADIRGTPFSRDVHWLVGRWQTGCTAGGSSGSPLFDAENRIVGLLSAGVSTCYRPENDYYYALHKAWKNSEKENEQLNCWLNPANNAGITQCDGLDPYAGQPCYRLSNIYENRLQEVVEITKLPSPADGNLFGANSLGTNEYAEEYSINRSALLYGAYLVTPSLTEPLKEMEVTVTVYNGGEKPGTPLYTTKFYPTYTNKTDAGDNTFQETEKPLSRSQESFVKFENPVKVSGSFYIGYTIVSPANASFAVYSLPKGATTRNTAWIKYQGIWTKTSAYTPMPFNTSLFVDPAIQYTSGDTSDDEIAQDTPVRIFIGKGEKSLYLVLPDQAETTAFALYSADGRLLHRTTIRGNTATLPLPSIPAGVYIATLRVEAQGQAPLFHSQKVVF